MMFDSRSPWYSGGQSRTDLEAGSSVSLLHSIYGSQVSQLPFSDYDSDVDLLATKSDYLPVSNRRSSSPALPQRRLARPKSSPASVIEARERQRRDHQQLVTSDGYGVVESAVQRTAVRRPGSAMLRQRPGTASTSRTRIARGRPMSAAGSRTMRPSSAAPSHFVGGGGASPKRSRPKTAMGIRASSSTMLLDLEEEDEEEVEPAPIIRDTPPVQLTRVPEYFNFWDGKPLLQRDFGVKVQKRKQWQRPKSDYGSRFARKKKGDDDDDDNNKGQRTGPGLETLIERDDSSSLGSRRASCDFGGLGGDQGKSGSGGKDTSGLSVSGEGLDSGSASRRGSKDFGGKRRGSDDRLKRLSDDKNRGSRNLNRWGDKKSDWDSKDGSAEADEDDYFKKNDGCYLPTVPSKTSLCAFSDPHSNGLTTDNSDFVQDSVDKLLRDFDKENEGIRKSKLLSDKDGERRERRDGIRMLTNVVTNQVTRLPDIHSPQRYESEKALASTSWMDGDGSGSAHTTRFELPMDLKTLEGMSPIEYLRRHCIISARRLAHCKKIFVKHDKDKDSQINKEEIIHGLTEAHHNCITEDQANSILELVQMADSAHIDGKLFAALCCLTERALNLNYLPLSRKEVIEVVDFEALDWKLRDCHISTSLRTLFTQL